MDSKKERKKSFLQFYAKSYGNISYACQNAEISRRTYYDWLKDDAKFALAVEEIEPKENFLDLAESKLVAKVKAGDTVAVLFTLKTLGKSRGYIEENHVKQETKFTNPPPLVLDFLNPITAEEVEEERRKRDEGK